MSGTKPRKLELKCRVCGILCYADEEKLWVHEEEPAETHVADVRILGRRRPGAPVVPPAADETAADETAEPDGREAVADDGSDAHTG